MLSVTKKNKKDNILFLLINIFMFILYYLLKIVVSLINQSIKYVYLVCFSENKRLWKLCVIIIIYLLIIIN
jgi:hypothetical protein